MKFETRHKSSLIMGIVCAVIGVLGLIPSALVFVMLTTTGGGGGAAPCMLTWLCPMIFLPLALLAMWYTIFPKRVVVEKGAIVLYRGSRVAGYVPLENVEAVRIHYVEEAAPEGLWSLFGIVGSIIASVVQEKVQREAGFVIRVKSRKDRDTWWDYEGQELPEKKIVLAGDWDKSPEKIVSELNRLVDRYS